MTAVPDSASAAALPDAGAAVSTRLSAIELRLRLIESAPAAAPSTDDEVPLVAPPVPALVEVAAVPEVERPIAADQWHADALAALTEQVARFRAAAAVASDRLRTHEADAAFRAAELEGALARSQARAARLASVLEATYRDGQAMQDRLSAVRASRAFRVGRSVARLAGKQPTADPAPSTMVAAGIDPWAFARVVESGVFDPDWYLATYPDVAAAGIDPLVHFMTQARSEHRCPGPYFDTGWYLHEYADDLPEGANPLAFYLDRGWRMGQRPSQYFDPDRYADEHPDVRRLDICPLVHIVGDTVHR